MSVFGEMLRSWGRKGNSPSPGSLCPLPADTNVDQLLGEELAILFKHSTSCPVSWAAHAQVTRFLRENPSAPVRMIRVIQERALSQKVAAATGVRHESPQIIVLRRGEVVGSSAHGEITLESLNQILAETGAAK